MDDALPDRKRKGRGAVGSPAPRFDRLSRQAVDDGWFHPPEDGEEGEAPPLPTTVQADSARTVISRNSSPDIPFEQSVNPYRGCEHGCVYCYARPTHAYLGLSPGLDFETRLFAKFDAPELLERELRARTYRCRTVALGTNTDCYQPIEREHRITRRVLEVLAAFDHPVMITTKSALVTRDIDLLAPMAARRLAMVCVSVTTLDAALARTLEPRAAAPHRRLATIRALSDAGIPVAVMASPMIPGLTDPELEDILAAAAAAGAVGAAYLLLRLPHEVKDLMAAWLEAHRPDRARRVLSLVRQCRDGRLNDPAFGSRFTGAGPYADLLRQRFHAACRRLGLAGRLQAIAALDTTAFRAPPAPGAQLALF